MAYTDLLRFNPWWENKEAISNDEHILRFNSEKIKHIPDFIIKDGVYVVRGPRQVGKTILVKLKIKELLERGVNAKNILFYSFELLRKTEDIVSIIVEYLETVAGNDKRYLFLDETTTVPEWARAIKMLVDRGDIKKGDFVLVTGSSSIDLKKGAERLPGRGIEGNEFYYLPCSFRFYLQLKGIGLPAVSLTDSKKFYEAAKKNHSKILLLNKEFASYISNGGFLYAINHGKDELTLEKYARWLEGDFIKWGKNPSIVKEIIQAVIKKACSQFSYHSIVKETSLSSHNTAIDYLDMVDEELFLKIVNKVVLPFKVERRKEKKAFFLDPLLSSVAERWADSIVPEACKVEHTVMSHLSRLGNIYFYNDGKKEIDCVIKISNKLVGVEVKWSANVTQSDTYGVIKTGIPYLLSKEALKIENNIPVIPVSLFLGMLDVKQLVKRDVLSLR